MKRFIVVLMIISLILLIGSSAIGAQEEWPNKPIRLIIGYGAGGSADLSARMLAPILEKELGQKIVCENKPGGAGTVAASLTATQKPDGYQLFTLVTAPAVLTPHMQDLPFNPLEDFSLISRYAIWQYGLAVRSDSPWKTFDDFIKFAKENPGEVSYSLSGAGNPQHLVMERLGLINGIEWKAIPFKSGPEASAACMGGHTSVIAGTSEQITAGDMRVLVSFDEERNEAFPDAPTLKELGYDIVAPSLLGIAGPAGIPEPIVEKLDQAIKKALDDPKFIDLMKKIKFKIAYLDHKEFRKQLELVYNEQGELIKKIGLGKEQ